MMQYSIVDYAEVKKYRHFRFDAQFYEPEILKAFQILERKVSVLNRDICVIKSGTTPPDRDDNLKDGVILLKTTDIRNNVLLKENKNAFYYIDESINQRMKSTQLKPKDVLINIVGATTDVIGRTAILYDDFPKANITQAMAFCRLKTDDFLPEFLYAFLQGYYAQAQVRRMARPTGQYNLNLDELGDFKIPVLDGPFQEIVAKLIQLAYQRSKDAKLIYRQAEERLLDELGLHDWRSQQALSFVRDYEEVKQAERFDAEYFQPKYQHVIEAIKQHDYFFIANIETHNRRGVQPEYMDDGEIKVVTSKHIGAVTIDYDNLDRTTKKAWDENKTAQIKQNDILIYTTGANVGRTQCYLDTTPALASNHVNILRLNKLNPIYAGLFINSLLGQLQVRQNVSGSAQVELYPSDISKFIIWNAPAKTQDEIANMVIQSKDARQTSKQLLEIAKRAVEIAIEQDEQTAQDWLNAETRKLGVEINI